MTLPLVLTIAGSDSGGGAGIQADLKTFQAFGAFGTSAITAVTVQNTRGVTGVHPMPLEVVRAQIRVVAEDLPPRAVKTGMLGSPRLVRLVADAIRDEAFENYVLDPVMVASSGDRLLHESAEKTILDHLVPLATLVTPNLDEAEILVGATVRDLDGMRRAARMLVEAGARAALVKGGHLQKGAEVIDVLFDGSDIREWRRPRVDTTSTHGTGCTLSAAVAAGLAHGRPLLQAVEEALDYVHRAIAHAPGLGSGHGPLHHGVPARVRDGEPGEI